MLCQMLKRMLRASCCRLWKTQTFLFHNTKALPGQAATFFQVAKPRRSTLFDSSRTANHFSGRQKSGLEPLQKREDTRLFVPFSCAVEHASRIVCRRITSTRLFRLRIANTEQWLLWWLYCAQKFKSSLTVPTWDINFMSCRMQIYVQI